MFCLRVQIRRMRCSVRLRIPVFFIYLQSNSVCPLWSRSICPRSMTSWGNKRMNPSRCSIQGTMKRDTRSEKKRNRWQDAILAEPDLNFKFVWYSTLMLLCLYHFSQKLFMQSAGFLIIVLLEGYSASHLTVLSVLISGRDSYKRVRYGSHGTYNFIGLVSNTFPKFCCSI